MSLNSEVINWLLEEDNPGVRVRTLTELCGMPKNHEKVKSARQAVIQSLSVANDLSWMENKGLSVIYNLTALAESGLTREDTQIEPVVDKLLSQVFDAGCGDMMTLRALVMLGYVDDFRVQERLSKMAEVQLTDGGWLCLHRVNKIKEESKSCIKDAMHALLLLSELSKYGISYMWSNKLIDYFLKRRLFYRMDNPNQLVLNSRPGWRMTDVFFPVEVMRVGLPVLLDALATLRAGEAPELCEAWSRLEEKKDQYGRVCIDGTLCKSYLPKERVGKPSKWATFYAHLAWKNKQNHGTI